MPPNQRTPAVGDAAEEYRRRWERDGRRSARAWYRRQAGRSAVAGAAHRLRGFLDGFRRDDANGEGLAMWMADFRLAFRALRKRPAFSATVVVTLALGIGAVTALFGVFRTVFLRPLPLPDSQELVVVMETASFGCCGPASGPDYLDWVGRQRSFDGMAALNPGFFNLTGLDEPERAYGTRVTASAFRLLGVDPLMGRAILPEDQVSSQVVVLSYPLWQRVLGGRPDVVGTSLELDGESYTIIGVMPREFDVPSPWARTIRHQFYLPFQNDRLEANRGSHGFPVIARLSDGATEETAQADMDRIMRELATEYPATNAARGVQVFTLHDYLYGSLGHQLELILAAAGLVLLIACGNVAGLQLARAAARETELAVRGALGASRRAVMRLLFSESLLLAAVGGLLGIGAAYVMVDGLKAVLPATIPRVDQVTVDGWALLFALGATAFTALAFGIIPSFWASRSDLAAGVREGGSGTLAPHKERVRDYFIIGQVAIGLVLAYGSALLVRSYTQLRGQEYGFHTEDVLTLALNPAGPRYPTIQER
ncbi:MAG TPA: ABC transporter permease, partial [Longimicrobiales bacterium]|nr:ABC transporter permease [Longimicrobiales bacterium]